MLVNLTHRDLVLIRTAMIRNLESIKEAAPKSYEESRDLLNGKLWQSLCAAAKQEKKRA